MYCRRFSGLTGLPSTSTSSPSSTCTPISLTMLPLTLTRPWAMISSHLRRDATPHSAMYFCNLILFSLLLYVKKMLSLLHNSV